MQKVVDLYNSIHLNLGIKRFLNRLIFSQRHINWLDNHFLFPFYLSLEKYFYTRIVSHYGADYRWGDEKSQNLDKKNYNFGYGYIHYSLIRNQRPKRILCLGSMYGFIPYMMARACKENGYGHVDFVDANYDIHDTKYSNSHYYGQGFWKKATTKDHFKYLGVNEYITSYVMTNTDFAKKYNYDYDYIYLDADHSYKGALQNLRLFWSKLVKEGFLCFHDIHFDRTLEGVVFEHGKVWKKLSKMPYKFELSNHYSGLGFVQKLTDDNPTNYL